MAEELKHKAQTGHTDQRRGRARRLAPPALLGIGLLLFGRSIEAGVNEWTTQGPSESRRAQERACAASVGKSVAGCGWASGFFVAGLDEPVNAFAVYDDGSGEALYAGGGFITAGGVVVNHIAKWDGAAWSALSGPSGSGTDQRVETLAVYDDGSGEALYAAGYFTTAGGVTVNHIAKWDGTTWSALSGPSGTGTDRIVYSLAVYDDGSGEALYAAGRFTTAGGVGVNHIAKWDGITWSALSGPSGTGTSNGVYTLTVYDDGSGAALYAAGYFTTAGGVVVNHIAKWDGTAWSALSGHSGIPGTERSVHTLAVYDDGSGEALYAAGRFTTAGGVTVNYIAKWDGITWSALIGLSGTGTSNPVSALAVYDDGSGAALYAGGSFSTAGGVKVNHIAKWDGTAWSTLSGPSGAGMDGGVSALAVYDDGSGAALYAGGDFTTAGGVVVNHIAKWDGTAWSALDGPSGTGTDGTVRALTVYDDGRGAALYAGGYFTTAGGVVVNHIAKWDGITWSALSGSSGTGAEGIGGIVASLAVYDDGRGTGLYAGGGFITAGGVTVNSIAKWDGAAWSALSGPAGTGTEISVDSLAVYDDGNGEALYAGGGFTTAGGVAVNAIAKWDGTAWSALSESSDPGMFWVLALAVYDDGSGTALYAGGAFTTAGGLTVNSIAKWDGTAWSALSGPSGTGTTADRGVVHALATYDDGNGEALYAGGSFTTAGGVASSHIGKWICVAPLFADGFESGDTSAWSTTIGDP